MISMAAYTDSARELNVEVAAIQAVSSVESRGSGFMPGGKEPVILFEPHIFWRELVKRSINPEDYTTTIINLPSGDHNVQKRVSNPEYADILYKKWRPGAYGSTASQHGRLQRASAINRDAALASASWGRFQIMGFNHKACGYSTLQGFVNAMYKSEDDHLKAFCGYLKATNLDDALRRKDWAAFARGYNGPGYKEHKYDVRLGEAYKVYMKLNFRKSG